MPAFEGLRSSLLVAMPGLEEMPGFVVGIRDAASDAVRFPANTSAGHPLPGWILALVTGWRRGESTLEMSVGELDPAIALLSPAESATMFNHPNLEAWRSIRAGADEDTRFVVRFTSPSP